MKKLLILAIVLSVFLGIWQVSLVSGCERGTGTPGYWKNHPDAWPASADELLIGGVYYTKTEAIAIMNTPEAGNKIYTLFRALVAAKLNAYGNDHSCVFDTMIDAYDWLWAHRLARGDVVRAKDSAWREGELLYEKLDDYNNGLLCAPSRDDLE